MALERLQALALFWVPQHDLVVTPAAREKLAVKTPGDGEDPPAAIFSNVREHICYGRLRLSPPVSTPLPEGGRPKKKCAAKHATLGKIPSHLSGGLSTPSGAGPLL